MTQTQHFIPEGWSRVPLSKLLTLEYGRALPRDSRGHGAFPVVGSSGIVGFHHEGFVDGPSIVVGRKGNAGSVSPIIHCCWPIDTTYYVHQRMDMVYEWLHRALSHARLGAVQSATGVPGLGRTDAYKICLLLPPRPEQRAIAHVLTTLDDLIADTEAAIAKLEAIRQGLLHDLLTRGLDDNGEVRDRDAGSLFKMSDLGRVPIEWDVVPLGRILDGIDAGKSPNLEGTPAKEGEWGVLKVSAVHPSGFRPHENKVVQDLRLVNDAYEVRDGDLLMTRANTPELVGLTCLVHAPPPRRLLCDKTLRLRVSRVASAAFVFYATQLPSTRVQIELSATGSSGSMKNIGQSAIAALLVPRPPLPEQARIASVLQAHDETLSNEIRALGKLEGLRYGLSAALLSGAARVTPELLGLPPEDGDV